MSALRETHNTRMSASCWYCRGRRLVCDSSQPSCQKCLDAGRDCPGYGPTKPVRFLKPVVATCKPSNSKSKAVGRRTVDQTAETQTNASSKVVQVAVPTRALALLKQPRLDDLDLIDALVVNNRVRRQWYRSSFLEGNLFDFQIDSLSEWPPSVRHFAAIRALMHSIMAAPARFDRSTVSALQLKAYRHHAQAIGELRMSLTHMSEGDPREKLNIALSTFWIALSELHVSHDPSWRPHFYVLTDVMNELGGIKHLWNAGMLTTQDVAAYTITLIVSNTTSPARQEVTSAAHLAMLSWYIDQYETWEYAPFPCPSPLFALIIRINFFRTRRRDGSLLSGEARQILEDITSFSPDEWTITTKKDHRDTWLMIAKVYRSAVLLYALGALDIVTPGISKLVNQDQGSDRVARSLTELMLVISNASHSTLVHYGLVWPTLMAGVYATSVEDRDIIQTALVAISRACGMVSPLVAKKVLEDFWSSGEHGWEACFKAPFSFLA